MAAVYFSLKNNDIFFSRQLLAETITFAYGVFFLLVIAAVKRTTL